MSNVYASSNNDEVLLLDSETNEVIANADVEIVILSDNDIINCTTDNEGVLLLEDNIIQTIKSKPIYVSVTGLYIGELFTVVDNNCIYLERTKTI